MTEQVKGNVERRSWSRPIRAAAPPTPFSARGGDKYGDFGFVNIGGDSRRCTQVMHTAHSFQHGQNPDAICVLGQSQIAGHHQRDIFLTASGFPRIQ